MRLARTTLLMTFLALAAAGPAQAQFLGGNVGLLMSEQARKDLGMDAIQTERTMALIDEHLEKLKEAFQGLRELPEAQRQEAMLERVRSVNEKSKAILSTILIPGQMVRYEQFELWISGVVALTDPQVQAVLNLNGEQKTQLRECADEFLNKRAQLIRQGLPLTKLEDAEMEKAMTLLNDEQKLRWNTMRGERPTF